MHKGTKSPGDKIYFVGIGGIAMSATACLAKAYGYEVSGSDSKVYEPSLSVLRKAGIKYLEGYQTQHLVDNPADMYILSSGEDENNPEVKWLVERGKKICSFPELLATLSEQHIRLVVGGTHGKSTTSAWLGYALRQIEDASFMVGAVLSQYSSNFYTGGGNYFVFEGDEYKSLYDDPTPKMKYYKPDVLILNNLELDHPDIYSSIDELKREFADCIQDLPDDGLVIYNADSAELVQTVYPEGKRSFSFGIENKADMTLVQHKTVEGESELTVKNAINPENIQEETYHIKLLGKHNFYNALAVITTLRVLGFQPEIVNLHLFSFQGIKRRYEKVLETENYLIVDDYAHHPTAINETLKATKEAYPTRKLWAVFEPHTFSRTEALLTELGRSFAPADQVLLAPIYSAREKAHLHTVTNEQLLAEVQKTSPNVRLIQDRMEALKILNNEIAPQDIVVVMSVGSFNTLAYELKEMLERKNV